MLPPLLLMVWLFKVMDPPAAPSVLDASSTLAPLVVMDAVAIMLSAEYKLIVPDEPLVVVNAPLTVMLPP